jgi:hypothetical protein
MSEAGRGIQWRQWVLAAITTAVVIAAGPAQAYYAINHFFVRRISADRLEVFPRGGLTNIDGWCAVGDYVITMMSLPPATPIWRISEPPRHAGESLVFSLSPKGAATSNGLYQLGTTSLSVTAGAARAFCPESISYWGWS